MMPVCTVCWSRPVISAARVGEQSAVVLNCVVLEAVRGKRIERRRRHGPAERTGRAKAYIVGQDDENIRRAYGRLHGLRKIRLRIRGRSPDDPFEHRVGVRQDGDVRRPAIAALWRDGLAQAQRSLAAPANIARSRWRYGRLRSGLQSNAHNNPPDLHPNVARMLAVLSKRGTICPARPGAADTRPSEFGTRLIEAKHEIEWSVRRRQPVLRGLAGRARLTSSIEIELSAAVTSPFVRCRPCSARSDFRRAACRRRCRRSATRRHRRAAARRI